MSGQRRWEGQELSVARTVDEAPRRRIRATRVIAPFGIVE